MSDVINRWFLKRRDKRCSPQNGMPSGIQVPLAAHTRRAGPSSSKPLSQVYVATVPGWMTSEENAMLACAGDPGYPQALTRSRMKEDKSWVNRKKQRKTYHSQKADGKKMSLIIDWDVI